MKNLLNNILSITAIGLFFVLVTATSKEEDICFLNVKIERTPTGFNITNEDDFLYEDLQMRITKILIDSSRLPTVIVDTTLVYELTTTELDINANREFPFSDFKANDDSFPSDDIQDFSLLIESTSPENGYCFFQELI